MHLICRFGCIVLLLVSITACSGKKKRPSEEGLSDQEVAANNLDFDQIKGRKIALLSISGEQTGRKIVEVALVNQIKKRGTFSMVSKQSIEKSKERVEQDPMDDAGIAKGAGADLGLRVEILKFDAQEHTGYSKEEIEDDELKAERGDGKATRYFRAKSVEYDIQYRLDFTDVTNNTKRIALLQKQDRELAEEQKGSMRFSPRLRHMEKLTNEMFDEFFTKEFE